MENKVYYGEYSLEHWIKLILKQNITLPPYQRFFVWNERKVHTLIETFKEKQFVPPVTIGAFKNDDDTTENLILDGQQRLTSILLAYLGLFPDPATFKRTMEEREQLANSNDDVDEDDDEPELDNIINWNIKQLTSKGKSKAAIRSKIVAGNYKEITVNIEDDFFKTTFLGFSYLVPQTPDRNAQQKYYSSVFRNINIQGEPLLPQESRASLYFLDESLKPLFAPNFMKGFEIKIVKSSFKIDFVRYLSMLSQYHKNESANRVARSYKPKMEKYYEEYIYNVINDNDSNEFGLFSNVFPDREFSPRLANLETALSELEVPTVFPSIIDADVYLFGLIYNVVFKAKTIDTGRKDELQTGLNSKIEEFKNDQRHKKSPNNLGHLRNRIRQSIAIYDEFTA
ncbi:MAG: DUF262 domain-containing protein [Bacteroidota bacterium]